MDWVRILSKEVIEAITANAEKRNGNFVELPKISLRNAQ